MLSDSQIDRYCRQIVLPEIGGRGQERLLDSEALIEGAGDAALFCAGHLVGAGVGALTLRGADIEDPLGRAFSLRERNPDCRWQAEPRNPEVVIAIDERLPQGLPIDATVFWGGTVEHEIAIARFPRGSTCASCLGALAAGSKADRGSAQLLGTLLALQALRVLLGLESSPRRELFRFDLARSLWTCSPFPSRPDCPGCRC